MKIFKTIWNFLKTIWNLLFWVGEETSEQRAVISMPRNTDRVRIENAIFNFKAKKRFGVNSL